MSFELVSWIYISFICLIWGNLAVRLIFRNQSNIAELDFSILCFMGMSVVGVIALFISLFMPLNAGVKIVLQVPAFFYLLRASNRKSFFYQLRAPFDHLSLADLLLLIACIVMILFLSTSVIIHPDTLNYHIYSIRIFDKYGMIPGIANLRLDLGFQSLWFAVMSIFDLSFFQTNISYPLSGCVLCWFIIFLIAKATDRKIELTASGKFNLTSNWYLWLLLFTVISWTQIRLTASSASPDFIVTLSILSAFYFFNRKPLQSNAEYNFTLAAFFALVAIAIKISAILIILICFYILFYGFRKRKIFLVKITSMFMILFLTPILIRNVIASGYPLYPSSFGNIFPGDWKISAPKLTLLQHYITGYARYPITMNTAETEYHAGFLSWVPLWWKHLYVIDKIVIFFIFLGGILNLFFLKKWIRSFSINGLISFFISLTGVVVWFGNGPDPRFGTGFLLPLLYFQYVPFFAPRKYPNEKWVFRGIKLVKLFSALLIFGYIIYRGVYFFHPDQLIFPDGIKKAIPAHPDCSDYTKEMLFEEFPSSFQLPDSCKTFIFRGNSLKEGFKPIN